MLAAAEIEISSASKDLSKIPYCWRIRPRSVHLVYRLFLVNA